MPSYSIFTYFCPPDHPEGRVLNVTTGHKLGYFFHEILVLKSLLFFTNEASVYKYESSDDEAQEAGGEEKKVELIRNEEPEKGPEEDMDPEESSPWELRYLCTALCNIHPFLTYITEIAESEEKRMDKNGNQKDLKRNQIQ